MAYFTEPMAEEIRKVLEEALGEVEKEERKKKTASEKRNRR